MARQATRPTSPGSAVSLKDSFLIESYTGLPLHAHHRYAQRYKEHLDKLEAVRQMERQQYVPARE